MGESTPTSKGQMHNWIAVSEKVLHFGNVRIYSCLNSEFFSFALQDVSSCHPCSPAPPHYPTLCPYLCPGSSNHSQSSSGFAPCLYSHYIVKLCLPCLHLTCRIWACHLYIPGACTCHGLWDKMILDELN